MNIKAKTIESDEEYLRQRSKEVDFSDSSYLEDIKILEEYCLAHEVLAMAAVQIGIPKRLIYIKNTKLDMIDNKEHNEAFVLINPIIKKRIGHTKYWEACASCLYYTGLISRPYEIEIEYQNQNNDTLTKKLIGFEATVFSHEYDHLDGILHIDKAEELLEMDKDERKLFRESHPYEIISKTCEFKEDLM